MDFSSIFTKSAGNLQTASQKEGFPEFNVDKQHLQKIFTNPKTLKPKKVKKPSPFNLSLFEDSDHEPKSSDITPFKLFNASSAKKINSKSAPFLNHTNQKSSIFDKQDTAKTPMKIQNEQQQALALKSARKCKGGQVTNTISGDYLSKLLFEGSDVATKDTEF